MVAEVYFCYICVIKLNFSLIVKLDVLPCRNISYFDHVACHVIIVSKFNKSANWWWIFSLLISKWAFSMQIEIIYLATSGMIFLDLVFREYKWSKVEFCWKTTFCPIKIFCEKRDGHYKRERKKVIALHLKRVFAGAATNFSNNGLFPPNVTWYVTWPVRSTNSTLKCSGRKKPNCVLNLVPLP